MRSREEAGGANPTKTKGPAYALGDLAQLSSLSNLSRRGMMEGARKTSDLQNSKVSLAPSRLLLVGSHDSYTEWRFFDGRGGRDGAARHNGVFLSFHTFMFSIYTSTRTVDTTYFSYGYDYIIFFGHNSSHL